MTDAELATLPTVWHTDEKKCEEAEKIACNSSLVVEKYATHFPYQLPSPVAKWDLIILFVYTPVASSCLYFPSDDMRTLQN